MAGMRLLIEVRDEDVSPLRVLALRDHRSIREQAGFLLALKIHEDIRTVEAPVETINEVVA
jgi:hypothetical protein